MNKTNYGSIEGNLEIKFIEENNKKMIMIYGDPIGLSSFGNLLIRLSQQNQNEFIGMPTGEREHIHIYPNFQLSKSSSETIIGRLDAKGTGKFPPNFKKKSNRKIQ